MKKTITVPVTQKPWALASQITYATVPSWYGATVKDLNAALSCRGLVILRRDTRCLSGFAVVPFKLWIRMSGGLSGWS